MEHREKSRDFREADRRYEELKRRHDSGALGAGEFDAELREMMVKDGDGRWWAKSRGSGQWMYRDESGWRPGTPPGYDPAPPEPHNGGYREHSGGGAVQTSGGVVWLWAGLGILFALLALLFFPPLLGGLAILFGYLAKRAGGRTAGIAVMITGGVCMALGIIIGALVLMGV